MPSLVIAHLSCLVSSRLSSLLSSHLSSTLVSGLWSLLSYDNTHFKTHTGIDDNTITDVGGIAMLESLQFNSSLRLLELADNYNINEDLMKKIERELKSPNRYVVWFGVCG